MNKNRVLVDVDTLTFEMTKKVRGYLEKLVKVGGSDLHLKAGSFIRARVTGDIVPFSTEIISREDALTFAKEMLRGRFNELVENKEVDLVYVLDESTRFRVNIFFQMDGVSAAFRLIPVRVKTIDELDLPKSLHKLTKLNRGLVLVTGPTGSGKSTTLAALIDEINKTTKQHIITIEDPIEFVHKDEMCVINQRNVGQDTKSFARALRAALREDPDVILVGEMRDLETIEIALRAAETGHLVFSTLHTLDAKETINRIISVFPFEEQNRIRVILASVLQGVLSQRLLKTVDNSRCAAIEVMLRTPRIEAMIADGREIEITEAIEEGRDIYGTQTFDQAILELYNRGLVSKEEAFANATSISDMRLKMEGLTAGVGKEGSAKGSGEEDIFDLKV